MDDEMTPDQRARYKEKIRLARLQDPAEKLLAGPRMFDENCRLMKADIRASYPGISDEQTQAFLKESLQLARRLEYIQVVADTPYLI